MAEILRCEHGVLAGYRCRDCNAIVPARELAALRAENERLKLAVERVTNVANLREEQIERLRGALEKIETQASDLACKRCHLRLVRISQIARAALAGEKEALH